MWIGDQVGPRGFNGARVCTPGKYRRRVWVSQDLRASMGPGFVHPGNAAARGVLVHEVLASMGPGFVHPGNDELRREKVAKLAASMGPGFVHPGNLGPAPAQTIKSRFNGARVCTPGKWPGAHLRPRAPLGGLQWGPGLYTREMRNGVPLGVPPIPLQWGPGLYTREIAGLRRQLGYALPGAIASAGG